MPKARDEIEQERAAQRRIWQQAFDRLAEYLRELASQEKQDDGQEPGER